jgi:hypothetical protein
MPKKSRYNGQLGCRLDSYDLVPELDWVKLRTPEVDYPDMNGAVEFCRNLLPSVSRITVYRGPAPDVRYVLLPSGKWSASLLRSTRHQPHTH